MQHTDNLTCAVKDAVLAMNLGLPGTPRHLAAVARATEALKVLFEQAEVRGLYVDVVSGYFKLSALEPHRLPRLVDSLVAGRLADVARHLTSYNAEH